MANLPTPPRAVTEALRSRALPWLGLCAATLLRLLLADARPNIVWPDEIFQSLEPAHRLVFGEGLVPWEFRLGARSWLLPALLALPMQLCAWLGCGEHGRWAAQALLCVCSAAPLGALYHRLARDHGPRVAWLGGVAYALWFENVYFAPKALSEVVAAQLLVTALLLDVTRRPHLVAALLGCTLAFRLQLLPTVLLVCPLALRGVARTRWVLVAAFVAPVLALAALDTVTWGAPFHSWVANLLANVVAQRSADFGTAPPWAYFTAMFSVLGWATPGVLTLAALGVRKAPLLALAAAVTLLSHAVISHKEYRFIYPASALTSALCAFGIVELARLRRVYGALALCLVLAASTERGLAFDNEATTLGLHLYPRGSMWSNGRGPLLAFRAAHRLPDLCALGLLGVPWFLSGGYTWLHREVELVQLASVADLDAHRAELNALVAPAHRGPSLSGFVAQQCFDGSCLFVRPGGCAALRAETVQHYMERVGE